VKTVELLIAYLINDPVNSPPTRSTEQHSPFSPHAVSFCPVNVEIAGKRHPLVSRI